MLTRDELTMKVVEMIESEYSTEDKAKLIICDVIMYECEGRIKKLKEEESKC